MDGVTVALDASTYQGSVAVLRDGQVVAERSVAMRGEHEERLMPAVAAVLESVCAVPRDVRRVVCGAGPGSFTSLRIAAAIAKGLAMATNAPLFAVSSLALAAVEAGAGRWLITLDAMRGEYYAAGFEWNGTTLGSISGFRIVTQSEARAAANACGAAIVAGLPHARAVAPLALSILAGGAADLALWEPGYGRLAEAQVRWEATHGQPLAR